MQTIALICMTEPSLSCTPLSCVPSDVFMVKRMRSKCNTEIAGMWDRRRDIEREWVAWEDEKKKTNKKKNSDQKRRLKSLREKALLLLNIKVIGHGTFLTTSLSFLNSLSVRSVHRGDSWIPAWKLKGLYLCLSAHGLKRRFQLNVTFVSTNSESLTWLSVLNLHWFYVYIGKWSSSEIDFSSAEKEK